jgi:hypothetical protein
MKILFVIIRCLKNKERIDGNSSERIFEAEQYCHEKSVPSGTPDNYSLM